MGGVRGAQRKLKHGVNALKTHQGPMEVFAPSMVH